MSTEQERFEGETGLTPRMVETIRNILSREPRVNQVVLFGSRAKGSFREGSDIDLAVYGTNIDHRDTARWIEAIEDALFPWSVDIVVVDNEIDSELSAHIARVGRQLFKNEAPYDRSGEQAQPNDR